MIAFLATLQFDLMIIFLGYFQVFWVEALSLTVTLRGQNLAATLQEGQKHEERLKTSHKNDVQIQTEELFCQVIAQIVQHAG